MSREEFDPAAAAAATMQDVPNVNVTNVAWAADWLRGEGNCPACSYGRACWCTLHASGKTATSTPRSLG